MSLNLMDLGASVTIRELAGEPETRLRLLELGFTPGQVVTPLARAPFGGPVAVAVRGTIVALREAEASCIQV